MIRILLFIAILITSSVNSISQINSSPGDIQNYYKELKNSLVGKELPNVMFRDAAGKRYDLKSLKGKKIAINIWAFSCQPCIEEIPKLNLLVDKYKASVIFISILGTGGYVCTHNQMKETYKIDFSYTTLAAEKDILRLWGLQMVYPTHIILDEDGKVLDLFIGAQVNKIERLLKI